jgi:hypothetical protein
MPIGVMLFAANGLDRALWPFRRIRLDARHLCEANLFGRQRLSVARELPRARAAFGLP